MSRGGHYKVVYSTVGRGFMACCCGPCNPATEWLFPVTRASKEKEAHCKTSIELELGARAEPRCAERPEGEEPVSDLKFAHT